MCASGATMRRRTMASLSIFVTHLLAGEMRATRPALQPRIALLNGRCVCTLPYNAKSNTVTITIQSFAIRHQTQISCEISGKTRECMLTQLIRRCAFQATREPTQPATGDASRCKHTTSRLQQLSPPSPSQLLRWLRLQPAADRPQAHGACANPSFMCATLEHAAQPIYPITTIV